MVNPVNNQGYYEYRRVNTKTESGMENGEKFSLDYGHGGKDSEKNGEDKTKVEAEGVIAEFSGQSQSRQYGGIGNGQKQASGAEENIDFGRAAEQVRGFLGELVHTITQFFGTVKNALLDFWNSDSTETSAGTGEAAGTEETAIDVTEMSLEAESRAGGMDVTEAEGFIERAPEQRPKGMAQRREEAELFLENIEGKNRYVKNSDLLTYYDRSGKIVQMSGSDKNRILHGDSRTSRGV